MTPTDEPEPPSPLSSWLKKLRQRITGHEALENETDLLRLLAQASTRQLIDPARLGMIEGVMELSHSAIRDLMTPRAHMVMIDHKATLEQVIDITVDSGHSRFPVLHARKDEVIGILHAKDLLRFQQAGCTEPFAIKELMREPIHVPESQHLDRLLHAFRNSRNHMAIVLNEFGSPSGLITIEDILEIIIGNIEDEHDEHEGDCLLEHSPDEDYVVKAHMPIEDFDAHFGSRYARLGIGNVGGLIIHHLERLPQAGESFVLDQWQVTVLNADSRQIKRLRFERTAASQHPAID